MFMTSLILLFMTHVYLIPVFVTPIKIFIDSPTKNKKRKYPSVILPFFAKTIKPKETALLFTVS
jgi:hypothetical protein